MYFLFRLILNNFAPSFFVKPKFIYNEKEIFTIF
jgi:hypothetical protein